MAIISTGESYLSSKLQSEQAAVITTFVYAYIDGLDTTIDVPSNETMPAAGDIVHQADVTRDAFINENQVVYSSVLLPDVGGFDYNWIGLVSETGELISVDYTPTRTKYQQGAGQSGDTQNWNVVIEYSGIAELSEISVEAESWQLDHYQVFKSQNENNRDSFMHMHGRFLASGNAFKVEWNGSNYVVKSGTANIGGVLLTIASDIVLVVDSEPARVWVDAYEELTALGVVQKFELIVNNEESLSDYKVNGLSHVLVKLAGIQNSSDINDFRFNPYNSGVLARKNTVQDLPLASLNSAGISQLNSSLSSESESQAATPKAIFDLKVALDSLKEKINNSQIISDLIFDGSEPFVNHEDILSFSGHTIQQGLYTIHTEYGKFEMYLEDVSNPQTKSYFYQTSINTEHDSAGCQYKPSPDEYDQHGFSFFFIAYGSREYAPIKKITFASSL